MNDFFNGTNAPVCFFDSGIGGLNLLYECAKRLPHKNFIYFADNYNVPYGSFSSEKLLNTVDSVFKKISGYFPCAAVIACNTVTAKCAEKLRAKYAFPIIGIQPAVKPAARDAERCLVLATPATAGSASVKELVQHYGNGVTEVVGCPDLASYIERNIFCMDENELLKMLPDVKADAVVLGCTHYAYIEDVVKKRYKCPVYDGLDGTANRLCGVLGIFDHFSENNPLFSSRRSNCCGKITFIGGDEVKNKRVFEEIISIRREGLGK